MKILSLIIVCISVMIMLSLTTSNEMSEQQLLEFQVQHCKKPESRECWSGGVHYSNYTACICSGSFCVATNFPPPTEE